MWVGGGVTDSDDVGPYSEQLSDSTACSCVLHCYQKTKKKGVIGFILLDAGRAVQAANML